MAMTLREHLIDMRRLTFAEAPFYGALAVVDLAMAGAEERIECLPPCPVIAIGDPAHPAAARFDTPVVSLPVAQAIVRRVIAAPDAAAVTVQLLRLLPGMPLADGLVAESLAYAALQGSAEHHAWLASRPDSEPVGDRHGEVAISRDGSDLLVVLNDPANGNAIDRTMRDQLYDAFTLAALDDSISRITLRGEGRTFCLGADLAEFGTTRDPATAHRIRALTLPAQRIMACADRLDAHVQGGCVGAGLEVAAWARRLTARADAWFQLPELAMGILPGAGGCVSLVRRIGRQRTAQMILSGKRINARTASEWGLIDAIVDDPA